MIRLLQLASCNLSVFPDLSNNSNFYFLDLSSNKIEGVVPDWVGKVSVNLQYLNLSRNKLVALQDSTFPSTLSILDISKNNFQGSIPVPPSSAIYVDYSNNRFNSSIPPDIGNNSIFFLSLSNNELKGDIPASICNASYLEVLDLSSNYLSGTIPPCLIERSDTLGVLNLRSNRFHGNIPDYFPETCQLQTLDLSSNLLEGKIPKSLANCTSLEVLNLGNNQITDSFPCYMMEKTSLRVLVLRNNNFSGPIGCPNVTGTWRRLQIVDLASNNFSGNLPGGCLSTWNAMIDDGSNTYKHLSFAPFQLNSLYYEDSITVTTKGLQMELLKILTVFTSIDFSFNKFEGTIPDEIGLFTALIALNLSHNAFTGQIALSLGNLSRLESLDLSENNLSGQIPNQLAALTFLSFLNLSNNHLSGAIPTGTQLQSFSNSSFGGNEGLCGLPLSKTCNENSTDQTISLQTISLKTKKHINWVLVGAELGYVFGLAIAVGPLFFWRRWRICYYRNVDRILFRIFPRLEEQSWNYRNRIGRNRNRNRGKRLRR